MMRRARSPVSMELPPRPVARSPRGSGSVFRALLFRVQGGRCFPATINRRDAGEHRDSARKLERRRTGPSWAPRQPTTSGSHCSRHFSPPLPPFSFPPSWCPGPARPVGKLGEVGLVGVDQGRLMIENRLKRFRENYVSLVHLQLVAKHEHVISGVKYNINGFQGFLFFAKTLELSLAHSIYRKGPPFNIISEASPKNYFFCNSNEDIFCEKVLLRFFALIYDFAIKLS